MKSSLLHGLIAALVVAACSAETDVVAPATEDRGTLVTSWTIAGGRDPDLCAAYGAAQLRLVLYDAEGAVSANVRERCGTFESRRLIIPAAYLGLVTLLDDTDAAVSGTLGLGEIRVTSRLETHTTIDFPRAAFPSRGLE